MNGKLRTQFGRTRTEARKLMEEEITRIGLYGIEWDWKDGGTLS